MKDRGGDPRVAKQHRFVSVALVVAVALVMSACNGPGDKMAETCECLTLETTVASIDWTGDGREPDETGQAVGFSETGQLPLVASATFRDLTSAAARDGLFEYVVSVMAGIGFTPIDGIGFAERDRKVNYAGNGWTLSVPTREPERRLFVLVTTDKPDEKTPEFLAPLVEAFRTR